MSYQVEVELYSVDAEGQLIAIVRIGHRSEIYDT